MSDKTYAALIAAMRENYSKIYLAGSTGISAQEEDNMKEAFLQAYEFVAQSVVAVVEFVNQPETVRVLPVLTEVGYYVAEAHQTAFQCGGHELLLLNLSVVGEIKFVLELSKRACRVLIGSVYLLHVGLVSRIARTVGEALGLNAELIETIAIAHDLGHAPFGHNGEKWLDNASKSLLAA